ncbi:cache domain-containing protein [Actimicrobium sp. CCI2.3]|uniref:cache domain-containing protein n=1 Tax=Actimicrobium sp. CCI2.3 TaxID=3048616 RepID=UPI002AB41CF5|nr:cache domain-containing protein [Actimicrobium sp. CCI2.3]MDY7575869.1 cache domain-containing protein [Actimicrobium sp. CCI2.3]MEB0021683.1 cache domain-containing protein [Actimicrobium sp. CCI2.3]
MNLRQKIFLLAVVPLIVALCAIALAVQHQATLLAQQQLKSVESAYLKSKEAEMRHYVTLATRSIKAIYDSGRHDALALEEAKRIISKLDYGDDGYFFVYDMQGVNLVHPRQPELVGQNLWELRDNKGNPTIQRLIFRANHGGGLERYLWEKPSTGNVVPKLGYVISLPNWGWVLGTGIYLDDVDAVVNKLDTQISRNIQSTMLWITGIAIASVLVIALFGLALNFSEHRVADAKLKVLAQRVVHSQEEERARLSRDLHDGISQSLVSIKLQVESGIAKLAGPQAQADLASQSFDRAAAQLNHVLGEVRRISHNLRPTLLDDLGLVAALDHLTREFAGHAMMNAHFMTDGHIEHLSEVRKTALFRIAQEALTNIERHAAAANVSLNLSIDCAAVRMVISDDGKGFDMELVADNPKRGIGLRNMHERAEAVGGHLSLSSSAEGTQLTATLPNG